MTTRKRSPLEIKTTALHMCTISERLKILSKVPFFQDLKRDDLEWVNAQFHQEDFQVDEVICHAGDPAERFYVVADGRVRLLQHSFIGRDILLDLLTPGEFFGSFSEHQGAVYLDTAQAHYPSCILVIGQQAIQQILKRYPSVALKVIDIMAKRLQAANERIHQLSAMPVEGRIASILLMLSDKFGEKRDVGLLLQVPLSREDLAQMTGTTVESASRVMSAFQKDKLIRSGREWVAVIDHGGLEAIAGKEIV